MSFVAIADRIEHRGLTRSICVTGRHALGRVCVTCAFFGYEKEWKELYRAVGTPELWARTVTDAELLSAIRGMG
jgi:hypothetical protein